MVDLEEKKNECFFELQVIHLYFILSFFLVLMQCLLMNAFRMVQNVGFERFKSYGDLCVREN